MSVTITDGSTTYRCDLCGTTTATPQRCYRSVTDERGQVMAGTESTYCDACQCTAPTERDMHEHHRITSPCDRTTCLHVTAVQDEDDYYETGGEHQHTHRGDPYWFDARPHLRLIQGGAA